MGVRLACRWCGGAINPGEECHHGYHHRVCCSDHVRVPTVIAVLILIIALSAVPLLGQSWPTPSRLQNVAVQCQPPFACAGKKIAPYADPLRFLGRFLDSQNIGDLQYPLRPLRGRMIRMSPDQSRMYMMFGSAVVRYDLSAFVSRLSGGEQMISAAFYGANACCPSRSPTPPEVLLRPDAFWNTVQAPGFHGQDSLYGLDVDDRGYVYAAISPFGWSIRDANLAHVHQGDIDAFTVMSVRVGARYFLIARTPAGSRTYDVTTPAAPVRFPDLPFSVQQFAKAGDRVAVLDGQSRVRVCTAAALVAGQCPLGPAARSGMFTSITSDGVNFFVLSSGFGPTSLPARITVISPTGVQEILTPITYSGAALPPQIRAGAGHLVTFGQEGPPFNARNLRLWRLSPGITLSLIPLVVGTPQPGVGQFFKNYYHINTTPGYATPLGAGAEYPGDVALFACPAGVCMAANLNALADLWLILGAIAPVPPPTPAPQPICPCPPAPAPATVPKPAPAAVLPPPPCVPTRERPC
mgnify:CR=1 FL=1